VYLAEVRDGGFTRNEFDIASVLGIGLIQIMRQGCREVLSSPRHEPIPRLQLGVFEKMGYGRCCICQCLVAVGERQHNFRNLSRAGIVKAAEREKGLIFWNMSVGQRKRREDAKEATSHERRFICQECVANLFPTKSE
jgi:hypothetical protein